MPTAHPISESALVVIASGQLFLLEMPEKILLTQQAAMIDHAKLGLMLLSVKFIALVAVWIEMYEDRLVM